MGKKSTGSITSRERMFIAMAENTVPTAANPMVDSAATRITSGLNRDRLKSTLNTGKIMASTTIIKM